MYAFRVPSHGSQKPQLHPFDFPQKLRPQHQSPPPPAFAGFAHQALQQRDGGGGGGGGEGGGPKQVEIGPEKSVIVVPPMEQTKTFAVTSELT